MILQFPREPYNTKCWESPVNKMIKLNQYTKVAVQAAQAAAKIHRRYFNRGVAVKVKQSSFDLVTVADVQAEQEIVRVIRKHFPGHNFFGEEQKYQKTDSEITWVIDPLDGTNNFVSGLPMFSVSIACARKGRVISGVVYDVMRDELFLAEQGRGAFLNGKRIKVSNTGSLRRALLITGFYYSRGNDMKKTLENIRRFFKKPILGIRRFGSAALDLCYVASGRAAGFWEFELNPWDFAAGLLLVKEAGGRISNKTGKPLSLKKSFVVASNGKLHNEILSTLR